MLLEVSGPAKKGTTCVSPSWSKGATGTPSCGGRWASFGAEGYWPGMACFPNIEKRAKKGHFSKAHFNRDFRVTLHACCPGNARCSVWGMSPWVPRRELSSLGGNTPAVRPFGLQGVCRGRVLQTGAHPG